MSGRNGVPIKSHAIGIILGVSIVGLVGYGIGKINGRYEAQAEEPQQRCGQIESMVIHLNGDKRPDLFIWEPESTDEHGTTIAAFYIQRPDGTLVRDGGALPTHRHLDALVDTINDITQPGKAGRESEYIRPIRQW